MDRQKLLDELRDRVAREGVVTHFGDDLDNRMALEALRRAGFEIPRVDRTPAGRPVPGRVNIDVGDPSCTDPVTVRDDGTVIIDHHYAGYPNTLAVLRDCLDIYVPAEAVELADTPAEQDPLEYRTGLSLARYASDEVLWELAEKGMLSRRLTDRELKKYGLQEASEEQRKTVRQVPHA